MAKSFPGSKRPVGRRTLGNSPVKRATATSGAMLMAEVVLPAMPSINPDAVQAPADAPSPDRVSASAQGSDQEEPQAPYVGQILVDVDTGPGGLGMVFWFQGG